MKLYKEVLRHKKHLERKREEARKTDSPKNCAKCAHKYRPAVGGMPMEYFFCEKNDRNISEFVDSKERPDFCDE
jgi:hypothetical protein